MIDSGRLGVFVGVLDSRGFLGLILSLGLTLGVSACSDPDERQPWPTIQMPQETSGLWKSPCMSLLDDSRYFEVQVNTAGKFTAVENQFLGAGCKGSLDDVRTRNGQVDTIKEVGPYTWEIKAQMYEHDSPGDLMSAEIMLTMENGQAHIKPMVASFFDLNDKIQKVWDDNNFVTWVLEQVE